LMMVTTGLFCSGQSSKSTPDPVYIGTLDSTKNGQRQKPLTNHNEEYIDSRFEYTDSTGRSLIIQNSFPKSGAHYTDPAGKGYIYAVFFTRIVNERDDLCELTIEYPAESSELPFARGFITDCFFLPMQ